MTSFAVTTTSASPWSGFVMAKKTVRRGKMRKTAKEQVQIQGLQVCERMKYISEHRSPVLRTWDVFFFRCSAVMFMVNKDFFIYLFIFVPLFCNLLNSVAFVNLSNNKHSKWGLTKKWKQKKRKKNALIIINEVFYVLYVASMTSSFPKASTDATTLFLMHHVNSILLTHFAFAKVNGKMGELWLATHCSDAQIQSGQGVWNKNTPAPVHSQVFTSLWIKMHLLATTFWLEDLLGVI